MKYMFEKTMDIKKYKWTAKRFEIKGEFLMGDLVLDFIIPSVKLIRHGKIPYAERWYWSWKKDPNTNFFCRIYFLAKPENHKKIWELIEEIRKNKVNNIIKSGTYEQVMEKLNDEELEKGIALEHASEMALIICSGDFSKFDIIYRKTFHHFFQPLLISDIKGLEILQKSIGLGITK